MADVVVLDASAILAVIQSEPGGELVVDLKSKPLASTVNIVEARTKLFDKGHSAEHVDELMRLVDMVEVDFTSAHSRIASGMRDTTRHAGLSLGDRACLALAAEKNAVAMTTDQQWTKVDVKVRVELLRGNVDMSFEPKSLWAELTQNFVRDLGVSPKVIVEDDGAISFMLDGRQVCTIAQRSAYFQLVYLVFENGTFRYEPNQSHLANLEAVARSILPDVLTGITSNIKIFKNLDSQ